MRKGGAANTAAVPRRVPCPATRAAADFLIVFGVVLAALPLALLLDGLRSGQVTAGRSEVIGALAGPGLGAVCWPAATVLILCGAGVSRLEAACRRTGAAALAAIAVGAVTLRPAAGLADLGLPLVAAAALIGLRLLWRPAVRHDFARAALRLV